MDCDIFYLLQTLSSTIENFFWKSFAIVQPIFNKIPSSDVVEGTIFVVRQYIRFTKGMNKA